MVDVGIGALLIVLGVIIGILVTLLIQTRRRQSSRNDGSNNKQRGNQGDEETGNQGTNERAAEKARQARIAANNSHAKDTNSEAFDESIRYAKPNYDGDGQYEEAHNGTTKVSYEDDGNLRCPQNLHEAQLRRQRMPSMIILVRHGESEGNADHTLYRTKPDNLVELTQKGMKQAHKAGKRVEKVFNSIDVQAHEKRKSLGEDTSGTHTAAIRRIHLVISPFERTRQTAAAMRPWFAHRIVRTNLEPRIREQEFANLQGHDFGDFRKEQKRVGRFWYRFPTGESGSDVYDRVKSWWQDDVMNVNERYGFEKVDAMVVVTHGLTMRFVLMQLFGWSPTTFHSVWNADNCSMYVLRKDLSKPGPSPYVFDEVSGDAPQSSIDLKVEFDGFHNKIYKLHDYLKIPPPRTRHLNEVKAKLAEQYPEVDKDRISSVVFLPFMEGAVAEQRTRTGRRASLSAVETRGAAGGGSTQLGGGRQERQKRFHHSKSDDLGGFCPHPELYAEQEEGWS
ncbi:unnamed protein product [Cylindrotheca closterium]|uniref:Uncharacterized protein n=1 Tax=Cylindrotheca closterium TaxID=2856 RepID=A0AAD2CP24_9STRA|nr:unnamed protein product [Cylindrotheca closterium]